MKRPVELSRRIDSQKQTGAEKGVLDAADIEFYRREYDRLTKELEKSFDGAKLLTCRHVAKLSTIC